LAPALWSLALTALLVLVAIWVAGEVAERHERENADTRLAAALRVAGGEFGDALADAEARAKRLARSPAVQRALTDRDRDAAARIAAAEEDVALYAGGERLAGPGGWRARRSLEVVDARGRTVGSVVAGVPLDERLLARLERAAELVETDSLVVADGDRISAGPAGLEGRALPDERRGRAELAGEGYRFAAAPLLAGSDVRLAVLTPSQPIEATVGETRRRAVLAALATVLLLALAVWTLRRIFRERDARTEEEQAASYGRRSRDVRADGHGGRRVRDAMALVGEALAATHDPEALLPVILQSAIGVTGAAGARVVSGGEEVARAGRPEAGGRPLALRLGADDAGVGQLLLYPQAGGGFDREAEQLAHWLAAQASIALENERLHRTVKRQAITDELTQLANRRRFTDTLGREVRRAERFGDPVALVLADLDDFKAINDRYGHGTGDEVLRRFADVLRENVRDFDLPVRFGGEEFAILLPESDLAGGERTAHRLAAALERLRIPQIGSDRPPVTASFGVASYPDATSAEELLSAADEALYRAKAEGKNRVATAAPKSGRTG
jgi:diguanylate cyclase (GGDEF)-like protein